jgi:hypothetical protein
LRSLDTRYLASRMHSKLQMASVLAHLKKLLGTSGKPAGTGSGPSQAGTPAGDGSSDSIPDAPGYSGRPGARIVPDRLGESVLTLRIRSGCPVTAVGVENGRIALLEAGGKLYKPDYVINTAPLNRFALMIQGGSKLSVLASLDYIHVVFVFVRLKHPGLLKTEWVWIPDATIPFYRMSEMKTLHPSHAPANATGVCLEASIREHDPLFRKPDTHWTRPAEDFLRNSFGIKRTEIIGMDVYRREYAYPNFTRRNTMILSRVLAKPYVAGSTTHEFSTGLENLSFAGRAGSFLYLLTPWAILSGKAAAQRAMEYVSGKKKTGKAGA